MARIAIVYYSTYGNTYRLAQAIEDGARSAGAETRLRKARELAPQEVIATQAGWQAHAQATQHVPEASLDDLEWADGYLFGSPTRYGTMTAQLKQFLDTTGPLWAKGLLANKPAAAFTGAQNPHGGQEVTLQNIMTVLMHWGAVLVPPGYTDPAVFGAGGNPYGVSFTQPTEGGLPEEVLAAGRYLGARVARFADVIAANRERLLGNEGEAAEGAQTAGGRA